MSDWNAAGSPVKALAAHPGYSATNLQSHSAGVFGKVFQAGNRVFATDADFGAPDPLRGVPDPARGQFHRPAVRDARTHRPVPAQPLARNRNAARALWMLSEQLTEVAFLL